MSQRRNLSIGMHGDEIKLLHRQLVQLGLMVPEDELRTSSYAEGTRRAVKTIQERNSLPPTGVVDEKTSQLLSELLRRGAVDTSDPALLILRGTVFSADGQPLKDAVVRAFDRDLRKQPLVGEAETKERGQYIIRYSSSQFAFGDLATAKAPVLLVRAFRGEQQIGSDVILRDPGPEEVVDFREELSEWETLSTLIMPLLKQQGENNQALPPWQLNDADFEFLAEETALDLERIQLWALSFSIGRETAKRTNTPLADDHPAVHRHAFPDRGIVDEQLTYAIFYGWFRNGLPRELSTLWSTPTEILLTILKNAINQLIAPIKINVDLDEISARIERIKVNVIPKEPEPIRTPELVQVLGTVPGGLSIETTALVARVLDEPVDPQVPVTEKLRNAGVSENDVAAVEKTLAFRSFAENHLPLITTLQKEPNVNSLRDLALTINKESFTKKIVHDRAVPEGEKAEDFAERLYTKLFQAEPTAVLRNMLADPATTPIEHEATRTNLANVLSRLPDTFNIKTTSVYEAFKNENAFAGIAPELHENIKEELKSLQRVAAISPAPEVLPTLMKAKLTSALLVSDMPQEQFVQTFAQQLGTNGEQVARETHENAVNARIRNEQALISLKEVKDGTGIAMVDKSLRSDFGKTSDFNNELNQNNLSWDSLFGDSNFCECGECTSVYGAANYFVELLQYLRNNNLDPNATGPLAIRPNPKDISQTPLQKLFDRRPDLKCLELTCANTNTILPYVDLVNEVMESYVAFQKTLPFNVTDETSGELLAQPQHTEYKAYEYLHRAVYPFSLPYHQPIDAARAYLKFLGTSRWELIDTFRSVRNEQYVLEPLTGINTNAALPTVPATVMATLNSLNESYLTNAADAEYLGLTQEQYVILTKEAFVSREYWDSQTQQTHTQRDYEQKIDLKLVHEYYGYASEPQMLNADENQRQGLTFVKDQFLKRTGLKYLELVDLLKTQSLNPNVPKEQALSIMDRIQFSYRYLQSLINNTPGITQEEKYRRVVEAITLITNPQLLAALNRLLGLEDPCNDPTPSTPIDPSDIKQWVEDSFESVGKIIVLDNGVKCIDGRLYLRFDNLVDIGFKIVNCQIIQESTGAVVGSINKTTGLVTLNDPQSGDWSRIVFTGNKGEKGAFVTAPGGVYFISTGSSETCDLDPVRLIHLDGSPLTTSEYDRIHRFIRLWRALGWTINETDSAVVGLRTTTTFDLSTQLLHQLVAVKKVQEKTGVELAKLLTFWTSISTVGTNSLYKRLFLSHNLLGEDSVFRADTNGRYLEDPALTILDHAPVLMAALNLKADDIAAIMDQEAITSLTVENVSKLYRYRLLSKFLGSSIADFISVLPLFGNPFANPESTLLFLEQWEKIEDAGFDYRQLKYIIRNEDDPKKPLALSKKAALQLAKTLYDGLNEIDTTHADVTGIPGTVATTELIREKASLLYDQVTVDNIVGLLEGTNVYAADSPTQIKDRLRPIALSPPATTQDYEYLQLDNYPLLKKKIKYDRAAGSLQIKGILTDLEKRGSSLFSDDDFIDTSSLVQKLTDPASDPTTEDVSQFLWNNFSAASQTILTTATSTPAERSEALVQELNALIQGASIATNFTGINLSVVTRDLMATNPTGDELIRLNRLLLEDSYPREIAKNKRIGFTTLRANLLPAFTAATATIETQQAKLIDEVFSVDFDALKVSIRAGDNNDLPVDSTNGDQNSATLRRQQFLELFLPFLREELTHRFIVNTLATQTSLANDVIELLITEVLETRLSTTSSLEPLYNIFAGVKETVSAGTSDWDGYLIPSADGEYVLVVKDSNTPPSSTGPNLSIDDQRITFVAQANSSGEWWSAAQKFQAGKVYNLSLTGTNVKDVFWKTATSSITSIPATSLLPREAEANTKIAFEHLQKAALLINGFALSADEIEYLSDHAADFSNINFNAITLEHFLRLEAYTRLRNSLPPAKINTFEFLTWIVKQTGTPTELNSKIEELTGWKKGRIDQLTHKLHFNLLQVESFRNEINLLKLQKALAIADKIGVNIDLLFDWANPSSDFATCRKIAESIQQAIRAHYNREDWEQAIKPLSDKLRENQKNALIAYLLVQPELIRWGVTDADGLFEYFLIDVQMDACMETSRIVQAISSVQLFIQRCFLGLERTHSGIAPELLDRGRWEWMQRYRVWEANRKVFLYPENWIESNLRDDKSAFFRELESELLQKDINKQNVEDALKAYLYKVDEVADMEMIGVYIEEKKKVHLFARTRTAPYSFYYRYLDLAARNWYPWEKMQVDIPSYDMEDLVEVIKVWGVPSTFKSNPNYKNVIGNGCYLTPVIWNGRLLIFFPQFFRKTRSTDDVGSSKSIADMSNEPTSSLKPIDFWEIKMAWSEYRNGKWTQKQLGKDSILDQPSLQDVQSIIAFQKALNDDRQAKSDKAKLLRERRAAIAEFENQRTKLKKIYSGFYSPAASIALCNPTPRIDPQGEITAYDITGRAVNSTGTDNFSKLLTLQHPFIDAFIKQNKATDAVTDAHNKAKTAANTLGTFAVPPLAADISKYKFVPVLSDPELADPNRLLGIKVYYGNQTVEKGVFEFNGSNITPTKTKNYTYNNLIYNLNNVVRFHHDNLSYIRSLQLSDYQNYHVFHDGKPTAYYRVDETYLLTENLIINDAISFHHSDTHKLLGTINSQQVGDFFKFYLSNAPADRNDVFGGYDDDAIRSTPNIYHELKRPYSIYNWELFFHIPMMLADALTKSQQFEEAMKWYHYVFDPLASGTSNENLWQFSPFKDTKSRRILDHILNQLKPNLWNEEINEWRTNPFKPHLVARSRPVAYMKWVVMKYVDNLVAWGDNLFRQDTMESINQATQLYVLAGHILGPRPQVIPKRGKVKPQTYLSLLDKWDAFSNAMVELELALPFSNQTALPIGMSNGVVGLANVFGFASTTYFCIPNNPKLMGYWDTIADRLFKIRHCENIEGVFRTLPLFEPPIDPALLVKAAAGGLSISSVLNDLNTPVPNYRFYYLLQKALELCTELKSMGSAMLTAIEKKETEELALIRAKHESSILTRVMEVKKQQLEEAKKTLEGLEQNRKSPEHRMKYYLQLIGEDLSAMPGLDSDFSEVANAIEQPSVESGLKLNEHEKEDMDKAHAAADWQMGIGFVETLASVFHALPTMGVDTKPFGIGAGAFWGFPNLANATSAIGRGLKVHADNLAYQSSNAGKKGVFLRVLQERVMQANAAGYEIKQIDKQILAQKIRVAIADLEINNQQKQMDNAQEIEEFLKNKYGNEELYSWMRVKLSALYHQTYSLAYDLAKKAEKVFRFERGLTSSNFIQAGYWDAGYNGLCSGEQLYVGLKQLEAAYHENRGYDYEITKHVSLRQTNPLAILQLKETGRCEFSVPEVHFDVDYPGHYKRRIKSVSITIPCVAGPYVGLNGTLRLLENKFRNSAVATSYPEKTEETDERFQTYNIPIDAIAASSGQNDNGMFELNFKDERYLPFEGAGVISRWRFELPSALRQFNYDTISDVIIHIRYTSVQGGALLKVEAEKSVADYLRSAEQVSREDGLFLILNLKHDFPTQWHRLFKQHQPTVSWEISHSHFPYLFNGKSLEVTGTKIFLKSKPGTAITPPSGAISLNGSLVNSWIANQDLKLTEGTADLTGSPIRTWTFDKGANSLVDDEIDDLVILVKYRVGQSDS